MTDRKADRLNRIRQHSPKYARIFERVYAAGRPRVPDAIRAKCLDCCGYSEREAGQCAAETCALYALNYYRLKRTQKRAKV